MIESQFFGHACGVTRRGAAKGDEGAAARVLAAFDCVDARRVRHVLVDDLADSERGELDRQGQRLGPILPYRRLRRGAGQRPAPAGAGARALSCRIAVSAVARSSAMRPPEKPAGSMRPSSKSASVTVAAPP